MQPKGGNFPPDGGPSMRVSGILGPPVPVHGVVPGHLDPADPHAGDEVRYQAGDFDEHVFYAPGDKLSGEEFEEWDRRFFEAYRGVLDGWLPWGATDEAAHRLGLVGPRTHDTRPLRLAPVQLGDSLLSDLIEDWIPDVGLLAPDRVLGPWADVALPRHIRMIAGVALGFSPLLDPAVLPLARATRKRPRPPQEISSSVRSVTYVPPMLWRVKGAHLEPLLPLSTRMEPEGRVAGIPKGAVAVVGRAVPSPEGWWLVGGLPLPSVPDVDILCRRLELEQLRLRRHSRRLTWEDFLRDRGEVLYRTCCEWLWMHDHEAALPCWTLAGDPP